ncbi:MAG: anthranilate phosphoribosyltransferase [Labilithrix sp.]|nr:anthranilate phosphoribosyltransferase [Labilithrix sp.]MCW5814238.1 anthranilate phosphoribosyltransferase [Labilithrix sp.]
MTTFAETFALIERGALGPAEVRAAFAAILAGAWTPVQIGAFATALRLRGEGADVIVAAAEALREVMTPVAHEHEVVLDTCGTGGDGAHTINVSTGAAVVVAACGVRVAKHGNRSVSSRCGSADVLEALGIPTDLAPERQAAVLRDAGIAFLMAPAHHPALRHAAAARRELGVRTIFNALGPLVNPARATHQLVGVYDDALRPVVAAALGRLGVTRAWAVRSEDGLDEVSPAAPTRVSVLDGGAVEERVVTPADFGVEPVDLRALGGGDAAENAKALEAILSGAAHPAAGAVVLNAAAALVVATGAKPRDATDEARTAIHEGRAREKLEAWRAAVRSP